MVRDMSANICFGWLVVIGNLSWLQQSSTRSFEWRPKGISHSLYVPWSLWYSWLGPNPNCSWTQTDLVLDPNPIWSRIQIRFGLEPISDLVSEPNPIWSWSQVGFGLGANSDLVSDPTRIWSRTQIPIWSWTQIPIWSRTLVCRNLVTLKMVTPKLLGTQLHRTGVQHWW